MYRLLRQDDSKIRFSFWEERPPTKYPDEMFPLNDLEIVKSYNLESMDFPSLPSTQEEEQIDLSSYLVVDSKGCVPDDASKEKKNNEGTLKEEPEDKKSLKKEAVEVAAVGNCDDAGNQEENKEVEGGTVQSLLSVGYNLFQRLFST